MYGATLLKTSAKVGVAGGAIYLTCREGVWGPSSRGSLALDKVQTSVLPTTTAYLHKVPSTDYMSNRFVTSWNKGVKTVFQGIYNSPNTFKETLDYLAKKR